ncbi:precorrin-4 C11-methyltransferase [Eubacterium ruminantium]|nr:precorrin-4 C11-methyltransferase [Eubacterium ruminantium]
MIHFTGAGPGAADLLTVRAMNQLKNADIIIYAGSLVNKELLSYAKENARIYDSKDMTLSDVIDVMKEAEEKNLELVRLHTGEPSIYGAVREQMDELDSLGIKYDSCPGVTAAFGAAAALNLEYTLPDVTQSLIITRMEGRTSVPEGETIESFARHKASMAVYLSTGMMEELSKRLINGGYMPDTPAAIVYKATWPDEKKVVTTVAELGKAAKENGIKNLAVVLVGDAVAHRSFERSRLYADDFSTVFREADKNLKQDGRIGIVINRFPETDIFSFTDKGEALAERIKDHMKTLGNLDTAVFRCRFDEVKKRLMYSFEEKRTVIFVGAAGIAVRSIAEFVRDKLADSPVIVVSEDGKYVIPILAGHMGGANELAVSLADRLGAFKVITTATDISGGFQIDNYVKNHQLYIADRNVIKEVAERELKMMDSVGEKPDVENNSAGEIIKELIAAGRIAARKYYLGIGCRRGKTFGDIKKAAEAFLSECHVDISEVAAIASIDIKKDEMGIKKFADHFRLPFVVYSAESLAALGDGFTSSEVVMEKVGIDNVCERAAVAAAKEFAGEIEPDKISEKEVKAGGSLHTTPESARIILGRRIISGKKVYDGITLSLAEGAWCGQKI